MKPHAAVDPRPGVGAVGPFSTSAPRGPALLLASGSVGCALPLTEVLEVMRPLPIEAVAGAPPYVAGLAVVRGAAVPVVALDLLLGRPCAPFSRFVLVAAGTRRAVLAVAGLTGVTDLSAGVLESLPPCCSISEQRCWARSPRWTRSWWSRWPPRGS